MAKFKFLDWLVTFICSQDCFFFEWDEGNSHKSESKHGLSILEIESCFLDDKIVPLGIQTQPIHSEERYGVLAKNSENRVIFVCFTIRAGKIRPISARKANTKEKEYYGK